MAKIERTKNTVTGALWGIIEKLSSIILPFIVRTVLIHKLGAEYLGLSSLFTSILQVLNLTELGFGVAAVFAMYKPIAEDDYITTGAIVTYLNKIYKLIGLITILLGILCTPFLRYFILGEIPADTNIFILFFIYIGNTSISYLLYAHKQSLLSALQLTRITSKIAFFCKTLMRLLQIIVLLVLPNYYLYIILMPIFTIISNVTCSYIVDKHYKQWLVYGELNSTVKDDIKKRLFPLLGTKLAVVLLNAADTMVVSAFLGLTQVAIYNNYYYVMSSVSGFLIVIYGAMQAGIGNALVIDSKEKILSDFNKFSIINNCVVIVCTTCLLCLYQPFMKIWVGETMMLPFGMVILFSIYFFSMVSLRIIVIYKDASGIWREDMFRTYLSCGLNILMNVLLVKYIGLYGVIGSSVFVSIFIDPWIARTLFKVKFKESSFSFYKNYIYLIITTIISCIITLFFTSLIRDGFFCVFIKFIICIIVSMLVIFIAYRKNKDFDNAKEWILSKIPFGKGR